MNKTPIQQQIQDDRNGRIWQMYLQGIPSRQIGKVVNLTSSAVLRIVKKLQAAETEAEIYCKEWMKEEKLMPNPKEVCQKPSVDLSNKLRKGSGRK